MDAIEVCNAWSSPVDPWSACGISADWFHGWRIAPIPRRCLVSEADRPPNKNNTETATEGTESEDGSVCHAAATTKSRHLTRPRSLRATE